jgi:hypothetical protein
MALPILTEFGYVTANVPFIHKVNDLLRKPERAEIVAIRPVRVCDHRPAAVLQPEKVGFID